MKYSINQKEMVDVHPDAVNSLKHGSKAAMPINANEVIGLLVNLGYDNINMIEQGYEREDRKRNGKGFYRVFLRRDSDKHFGLMLIDSKDAQSSLKVFAGIQIADLVFPMIEIFEVKHRRHDAGKLNTMNEVLPNRVTAARKEIRKMISSLKAVNLSPAQIDDVVFAAAQTRMSHHNYRSLSNRLFFTLDELQGKRDAYSVLRITLAYFVGKVGWPRHFVSLSMGITNAVSKRVLPSA